MSLQVIQKLEGVGKERVGFKYYSKGSEWQSQKSKKYIYYVEMQLMCMHAFRRPVMKLK